VFDVVLHHDVFQLFKGMIVVFKLEFLFLLIVDVREILFFSKLLVINDILEFNFPVEKDALSLWLEKILNLMKVFIYNSKLSAVDHFDLFPGVPFIL
jgi:aspartokinase-like uncharacterized kinase